MALISRLGNVWQLLLQHKQLFIIGLCIKVLLGTLFAGDYLIHLFSPFLKYSTTQNFTTAYDYFNTYGKGNEFPYPYIMQLILGIPKFILSFLAGKGAAVNFIDILSVRIALLLADVVILTVLLQWLRKFSRQVMWLYWLSPILIYINYVHGQLDGIPVALLMLCLYYLLKNKLYSSIVLLILAIGCKTSMVLAIPFIVIAAYKMNSISKQQFWKAIGLLLIGLFFIFVPAFFSKGYWVMVFNNSEQFKLFSTYLPVSGTSLFLIVPALYFLLVIRFATYWQVSRDLLLMYLGFAFGLITIFVAANQGWYYWCLPFFIYFVVKQNRYAKLPFILLTVLYFLHFAILPTSDYARVWQLINNDIANKNNLYQVLTQKGVNVELWRNCISTLLQTTLLAFCYGIYRYGITQLKQYKMLHQPYLIGISGDSASGKTTLAQLLQQLFTSSNATIISGDDMHKWERGDIQYNTTTHLNPAANNLHTNRLHFLQLAKGNAIRRRSYNHNSGFFDTPKTINAAKVLIFEGLHTYYLQHQASLFDICIFTKPNETLRTNWKIKRDVKERGHTETTVLQSLAARKQDADNFIMQQEQLADVVISIISTEENNTLLELKCSNSIYFDELVNRLQKEGLKVDHRYTDKVQLVIVEGTINNLMISNVGEDYAATLATLGFGDVAWNSGVDGLMQVLLLHIIFYKLELQTLLHTELV